MNHLYTDINLFEKSGILLRQKVNNWRSHVEFENNPVKDAMEYTHIAIMKSSWKLLPKILSGEKTVESRWYKFKACPWNRIFPEDIIYFKDSGKPVTVKARVTKVQQYIVEDVKDAVNLFLQIGSEDLGIPVKTKNDIPRLVLDYISNKKYATFVYFDNVQKIKPFNINKKGFGMQAAWMCVGDLESIVK